jgi:hypothetical protein
MKNKELNIMKKLTEFYSIKNNIDIILPIIEQRSKISLRLIDWFVTNYSKKNNTNYTNSEGKTFFVYLRYKAELKSYQKNAFDPFCRGPRIKFQYDIDNPQKYIETTVKQLCFFKWVIKNNILDYINKNFKDIEKDMTDNSKKEKTDNKRTSLSINATRTCTKRFEKVILSFE